MKNLFSKLLLLTACVTIPLQAASPTIYINEIMFHPVGTNKLEQWFELYNPTTKNANLAGWKVTRGVGYTFPAGTTIPASGYLVVAADAPTFHAHFPTVSNYVGGWTGSLGHHLEISDASGKVINAVEFYGDGDWATRVMGPVEYNRKGWEWYAPADGLGASLELINPALPNSFAHNWAPNTATAATPGQRNSVATNDALPFVSGVGHWPTTPKSTDNVYVTARITDEALATTAVFLNWRVDGTTTFTQTAMTDDGTKQDGIANDGVYAAIIPPHADHTIIEFFITATDAAGHVRAYPAFVPPGDSTRSANLLFQVDNSSYTGNQPLFRVIMTEAERAYLFALGAGCPDSDSDAEMNGTWITTDGALSGGTSTQVRYNVGVRNRGHGTRQSVPHNYHINIPSDRLWKGQAGINLNSQYAHSQVLGSAVMRAAGLAMPDSRAVQLRVNGANLMANGAGNSFGSYAANEQYNGDFIQRTFPLDPDGNSYRGIRDQALCDLSTHEVADLSWHGPNYQTATYTNAYYKQNNFVANDWSDLIKLISVLNVTNGTTAATYVNDAKKTINVEEWMRYFAADTLLANGETALANGVGDDFALYRGTFDTRFQALPYDMDTVMGRGIDSSSPRYSLFRMAALPVLDRLVKTPEFAPLYYKELKDLADTVFSDAEMNPLLDHLFTGFVSADAIANMKAFNASQRAYVLSQIPLSLTVTSALSQVSGYLHATTATTSLTGGANAIETKRVVINGRQAAWVPWQGSWSLGNIPLNPGLNRLTVRSLDANNREVASTNVDVWYDDGSVATAGTTIVSDTTWSAAGGPYNVASSLTINSGATLTIEPGATIYLGSGANLNIASGGRLLAEGTEAAPIRFTRAPGGAASWGQIVINGGVGTPETRISHAHIEFNGGTAIHSAGGTLYLDHLTFGTTTQQYVSLDTSSFVVSYCLFPTPTSGFEPTHGTGGVKPGGHGIFFRNFFGAPTGYNDVFDFTGGQRGQPILYFVQNVMSGGGDDGLDVDGTDCWVEGNIFMHIHQNGAPDSSSAVSGGNNNADTSEVTMIGNIIFDCDDAATAKQGNFFTLFNNTIVHITNEGGNDSAGSGVVNVRDTTPDFTTFGKGYYLEGNIIQDVTQLVRNNDPTQAPVTFNNNIIPMTWNGDGTGNGILEPLLKHVPSVAEAQFSNWEQAQVMWDWFSLLPGSPAKGTGPGGKDLGAVVPLGVYLSGFPTGTNSQTNATIITVGVNRKGFNIPTAGWPEGTGFIAYKWRLDGGAWSAETPITSPIILNGLSAGPHSVDVVGKSDAGIYQNDPLLGDSATITSTGTWFVDPSAPAARPSIWINEILARSPANVVGATPDLVEFYNYGTADVDLGGWHVTRSLNAPFAFTFPAGTTLQAGKYLVVQADAEFAQEGLHLGFNLNADGDALYLLNASSAVIDSIQFGAQIAGYSIGRGGKGEWTLCEPNFGGPNLPETLSEQKNLRINEWLTDRQFAAVNSFVEIYNPNSEPAALSGLFLSDTAGAPNRFPFPALSFIEPGGFVAFATDGLSDPGHVNFKLSSDVGLISLSSSNAVVDLVEYGPQTTDVSEGRSPNGSDAITFFTQPTPGAANPGGNSGAVTNITRDIVHALPLTNLWRYNENGTDLGTGWRATGYLDTSWSSGRALFYHGNAPTKMPIPVQTTLTFKSPEQWTYYFRSHFNYSGSLNDLTLTLTQIIDDGIVVYLNGNEVYRKNMPNGTISYSTPSTTTVSDATESVASNIPATGIVAGDNVIAVEVHQANLSSSDIAMALAVDVVSSQTNVISNPGGSAPIVLNEVFAKNVSVRNPTGSTADWVEIFNPGTNALSLGDISITDDVTNPRKFVFAPNAHIDGSAKMLLYFDNDAPAGTNNTGFKLEQDGATIFIFDSIARGGGLIDSVRYGLQVANLSLSRIPDGSGPWTLSVPTPLATNQAVPLGSPANLRINEWMASSSTGNDWFEMVNLDSAPVALGGLYLSDDLTDRTTFRIEPLSFIGAGEQSFVRFEADSAPEKGARHVNFNLAAKGEEIGIYQPDGTPIDSVVFGAQVTDVSQGRLPDGTGPIRSFPDSASPGESNYLPLTNVVINEALVNVGASGEQQVELFNPTGLPVDIGGWFLSDSSVDLKQFRIPDGTTIPANGYVVLATHDFAGSGLVFDGTNGDSVALSAASADGTLSGLRTVAKFGPAEKDVSFGRFITSVGSDFTALSSPTFGSANAAAKVGPIVISEIMYLPIAGVAEDDALEFIELENISGSAQPLFDTSAPTNAWALRSAVHFDFPTNITLAAGERVLVTPFDPHNSTLLAAFKSRYAVSESVRIFGPWNGHLDNTGESVQLVKPGVASPGAFAPEIVADEVNYSALDPWPSAVNPGLDSLQRIVSSSYGNEPLNWKAATPTAGLANTTTGPADSDGDGLPDDWEIAHFGNLLRDGSGDFDGDGFSDRGEFLAGTDPGNALDSLRIQGIQASSGNVTVRFNAVSGRSYRVESTDSLVLKNWTVVQDTGVVASTGPIEITDSNTVGVSARFYRVRLQ